MERKDVYNFAVKWNEKFRDLDIDYIELVDHYLADDCSALGFEMDCGHAFEEKFKRAYLKQDPQGRKDLNQILTNNEYTAILSSFRWSVTSEGYDFWCKQNDAWKSFCKKINNE